MQNIQLNEKYQKNKKLFIDFFIDRIDCCQHSLINSDISNFSVSTLDKIAQYFNESSVTYTNISFFITWLWLLLEIIQNKQENKFSAPR